jgi:hypothetical protein
MLLDEGSGNLENAITTPYPLPNYFPDEVPQESQGRTHPLGTAITKALLTLHLPHVVTGRSTSLQHRPATTWHHVLAPLGDGVIMSL